MAAMAAARHWHHPAVLPHATPLFAAAVVDHNTHDYGQDEGLAFEIVD